METNPHYAQLLEKHGISRIEKLEDITAIFNVASLDREEPEIFIDGMAMIIFDTPVFNSAYILDEFDKASAIIPDYSLVCKALPPVPGMPAEEFEVLQKSAFEKLTKVAGAVQVFYCDDEELHASLFECFINGKNMPTLTPPSLIMVNSDASMIFIDMESMYPIGVQKILMAYLMLHDAAEMKESVEASEKARRESIASNPEIN
jgi:hypothetical protein